MWSYTPNYGELLARIAAAEERQADALEKRVRLAAITAAHRGLTLPPDLEDLTTEGAPE